MLPRLSGTFSPTPPTGLNTGVGHASHSSQSSVLNASTSASPSTNNPTGNYGLSKIAVAQVSVLLSTLRSAADNPAEYQEKLARLKKLINDHGMEVYSKFFTKLVATSSPQIFPGISRSGGNAANAVGNYNLLQDEVAKICSDVDQANKISESIETGTEDIFRDFDLSSFMEHFRLDALEKSILALAFKMGNRPDLKTKADAIISTNLPTFISTLSKTNGEHHDLSPHFLAVTIDRLMQYQPTNFNAALHRELVSRLESRYAQVNMPIPSELLAALDLNRILVERPSNALVLYMQRMGADCTRDEETCIRFLQERQATIQPSEEQVSNALMYSAISQSPEYNAVVLVTALRRMLPADFRWQDVVSYFDQPSARVSAHQFLRLYRALLPIAQDDGNNFDIQRLWGGSWANADAQLSFICAFGSLSPEELDASTIPGLRSTFSLAEYAESPPAMRDIAQQAVRHPLVSLDALTAVINVALTSMHASQTTEAKRLFNDVVVPNLYIFVVSAFGVPKPWPVMATDTLGGLFEGFLNKRHDYSEFALHSLWRKDKNFVKQRLTEAHGHRPMELPLFFEQASTQGWLEDFIHDFNGFGLDLVAFAHGEGQLDLESWTRANATRSDELAPALQQFLVIKAKCESDFQRSMSESQPTLKTAPLKLKTAFSLLNFLSDLGLPETSQWINCQRSCLTAYPRLINYGGDFDDVIDVNGKDGNQLPPDATARMEEHYKSMYNQQTEVRHIVEALDRYKHSRDPLDQDVFACMIHGLFDEYVHFKTYPIDALATTAVLFGGMFSRKLVSGIPLNVGLGMIMESVREYAADENMYKFGVQALMQLYGRFPEWPNFCRELLQIPTLQSTEVWRNAEAAISEENSARQQNGVHDQLTNGNVSELAEPQFPPFASINVEPPPAGVDYEDPTDPDQDKIQFALNNMDEKSLRSRFDAIRGAIERKHQQWFAVHLVQQRAKTQPNLHLMCFDLIKLFEDDALWAEMQRATLACIAQMLNSESTLHSSSERTHLKNLGGWLGMLTLTRDKPIRHQHIAFKQLLIEAYDTKRLVVVIPFVCKVLDQGKYSTVFRPPNPWLMDIIYLLIELYHNGDIKLNQKFEIEVLCKNLSLDHKTLEPSGDIVNRVPVHEAVQNPADPGLDSFDRLSINGLGQGVSSALLPQAVLPAIPDLGSRLNIPPTNEMVISNSRLREIVNTAFNKALQDIIQPVVDRSVTIAAISTQQMIHKDFATEPDEDRVRSCAINMVKATAGSLALVTSKEPLRANFTNYMRQFSGDVGGGLPEGTIIMCVNSNLDLASGVIEEAAERRAIPEIEEMISPELEARRRHRAQRPNQAYVDASLNRWAMTMPDPYKMAPSMAGLNPEQMAIYEEFQRQPRPATTTATPGHIASTSDATRSMANEVLHDQYTSLPAVPTPAETPLPHIGAHTQNYGHGHAGLTNGRQAAGNAPDLGLLAAKTQQYLIDLQQAATEAPEGLHYDELPGGHPVLDKMDQLTSVIIKARTSSEEFVTFVSEQICQILLGPSDNNLTAEACIHALHTLRRMSGQVISDYAKNYFQRPEFSQRLLRLPLIKAFVGTEFLEWRTLDEALSRHIYLKDPIALQLLDQVVEMSLVNQITLFASLGLSLQAAHLWILEGPEIPCGEHLKLNLESFRAQSSNPHAHVDQMEYVFEEWVARFRNADLSDKIVRGFLHQMHETHLLQTREDFLLFIRTALDNSILHFEQQAVNMSTSIDDAYVFVDALAQFVVQFVKWAGFGYNHGAAVSLLEAVWAVTTMVMNYHNVKRPDLPNQRVFHRFLSELLYATKQLFESPDLAPAWGETLLMTAKRLNAIGPMILPGFVYAWMTLTCHRAFLPDIMRLDGEQGWEAYTALAKQLLEFAGNALKSIELPDTASKLYEATSKYLIMMQHDYSKYMSTNSTTLLASIPPHCLQLINTILTASPSKMPDPIVSGLQVAETTDQQTLYGFEKAAGFLQDMGLLDIIITSLEHGPSEDAVAHMTHAMSRSEGKTAFAHAPIQANQSLIDALTIYIGVKAGHFERSSSSVALLTMLLHELAPEPRHYLVISIINQLKSADLVMMFYSKFLLYVFGPDLADPENIEVREQIVRVLLERLIGFWPQPWGLVATVVELVRNETYMFFELPFIKSAPEVGDRFLQLLTAQN